MPDCTIQNGIRSSIYATLFSLIPAIPARMYFYSMNRPTTLRCFLLTHSSRDRYGKFEIELFATSEDGIPVTLTITTYRPLFFIARTVSPTHTTAAAERRELPLQTFDAQPVDCLYFSSYGAFQECAQKLRSLSVPIFESDINPVERYLMERMVMGGFEATGSIVQNGPLLTCINPHIRGCDVAASLSVLSFDIETHVATGAITSIAVVGKTKKVFLAASGADTPPIYYCDSEKNVLTKFLSLLRTDDPDILIGWNVIDFDLKTVFERCAVHGIAFIAGRDQTVSRLIPSSVNKQTFVRLHGRVVLDLPILLRSYYRSFEAYSLNFVAHELLGKAKTIEKTGVDKIAAIDHLFATDKIAFARYNLQDALLTKEIFDYTETLPNAVERSKRSGHLLDRIGGSIASFDYLYLPRLHRAGYVAPDAAPHLHQTSPPLPGGHVIEPDPGIYEQVLVFDFRSLYPSIIMTFAIDPLGLHVPGSDWIQGPVGPAFARKPAILPHIIAELLAARDIAKKYKNVSLSQAIKILMNSFYGVLGTPNCRFFSSELSSAITLIGQYILKTTIAYVTANTPYQVIYGDTDSLFVLLGPGMEAQASDIGTTLARDATSWLAAHVMEKYNATSALLLQYEQHFDHFLIPTVRGASHGSKKHYCGSRKKGATTELLFKGMESARSDWTELAKEVQQELIRRIFSRQPVGSYITTIVAMVKQGKYDDKLIYKKRLRKPIDSYTVNIPPHVQAARLLDSPSYTIRYLMTIDGPQPVEHITAPIDYGHYIDCQLSPVADSLLGLVGKRFDTVLSGQLDLFSAEL